jgi:hypothetical protein
MQTREVHHICFDWTVVGLEQTTLSHEFVVVRSLRCDDCVDCLLLAYLHCDRRVRIKSALLLTTLCIRVSLVSISHLPSQL